MKYCGTCSIVQSDRIWMDRDWTTCVNCKKDKYILVIEMEKCYILQYIGSIVHGDRICIKKRWRDQESDLSENLNGQRLWYLFELREG